MFVLLFSTIFLTICTAGTSFHVSSSFHPPVPALCASPSDSSADDDLLDITGEETVLKINFSFDSHNGSSALAAVQLYTKSFPFAAVLPVQPLTYIPGEHRVSGNPCESSLMHCT